MVMKIKEDLDSLRHEIAKRDVTNNSPLEVPPHKKNPPDPPKELTPPLSPHVSHFVRESSNSPSAFDRWWTNYPDKTGKGAAKKAFAKALTKASEDVLLDALERYKRTKPDWKVWCNPATWLNQERWNDVPADATNRKIPDDSGLLAGPEEHQAAHERWKARMGLPH